MGIVTEYNPDLALRARAEFQSGNRREEECLPSKLVVGQTHSFLKKGQRNYWLEGEIPLLETKGNQNLSSPIASIIILEATHFLQDNTPYTKGEYKILEVFNEGEVRFNGFAKLPKNKS